MKKFMKYEIKGTYKFILGILLVILLASSVIQYNIFTEIRNFEYNQINESMNFLRFMFVLSIFIIFGAFITAFFYIVGSFKKELYEDRGYLTFTLPLSGNQILGSKLLVALMWNIFLGISTALYNIVLSLILFKGEVKIIFEEFIKIVNIGFVTAGITGIVSALLTLILIYFSISLSKVSIRNKKIGGMWFIIFLIISGITSYISSKIGLALPYYLDLNTFKITALDTFPGMMNTGMMEFSMGMGSPMVDGMYPAYLNIASFITEILFGIAFFMGTGYLIEERVEL
ncbi:hypothetical protein [Tissierella creatinophila]|uniref:ABC-2 family transporter protein n=1 Tax=Tissierella creatinophila DSM 6911 TaxID=1123403 RepID=A0A1U7M721_TISCR|nr:hypothetical protein [Tissierella creatinophila]OLS03097.1 hypothetical protein TICRE_07930 [Tissierella creatinophila DSM 6911]